MPFYIGLDLGGTNIKGGVIDDRGKVKANDSVPTPSKEGPEAVIGAMVDLAHSVASQAGLDMAKIDGVGIGSPGPIDFENGVLASAPNIPEFNNVPLRDRIAKGTGRPTVLENDANAAALGEYWIGAGRDASIRHLITLTLGTGVGSGVVVDDQIIHGALGRGGEAGHMIVVPEGGRKCGCGQRGCLETYASASHTARRAEEAMEAGETSSLNQIREQRSVTAKDVFDAAKAGDTLANRLVNETAMYLGIACVNLSRLLDPQMIVLAGGMVQAGEFLIDRVREAFTSRSWAIMKDHVRIVGAALGNDAGIIGAAAVAWHDRT